MMQVDVDRNPERDAEQWVLLLAGSQLTHKLIYKGDCKRTGVKTFLVKLKEVQKK
jgi:hypothetical protein